MEWLVIVIIVACVGIGKYFEHYTDDIDSPGEQAVEAILKEHNIDEDFSKLKKKKAEEAKAKKLIDEQK